MTKYLINRGNIMSDDKTPSFALAIVGDSSIKMVGDQQFIDNYKEYFEGALGNGWGLHLETKDPLASFSSTYSDDILTNDSKEFEGARKAIMDNGGVELEVSWEKTQS